MRVGLEVLLCDTSVEVVQLHDRKCCLVNSGSLACNRLRLFRGYLDGYRDHIALRIPSQLQRYSTPVRPSVTHRSRWLAVGTLSTGCASLDTREDPN